jgi:hypothetical protein
MEFNIRFDDEIGFEVESESGRRVTEDKMHNRINK